MQASEYQNIYEHEQAHWWYAGLHGLVRSMALRHMPDLKNARMLDAGCGTGGLLKTITCGRAHGIDHSALALGFCQRRGLARLARAGVENLPFASASFNLVTSMDVLYHANVAQDQTALGEFYRVLRPSGLLILHLPAYEFLRSHHDIVVETGRRYRRSRLERQLRDQGFDILCSSYRVTLLFPLVLLVRLGQKFLGRASTAKSDVAMPGPLANRILLSLLRFENALLGLGLRLPFGLSVFCIAQKKSA